MSKLKNKCNILSSSKGFTLIELLVVIAIIGILSSVVLASLNTARQKGNDAKMKSELSGLRAAAELYYDSNTASYNNLFNSNNSCASGNTPTQQYLTSITGASSAEACYSSATVWVMSATLPTGSVWCVDYLGNSKSRSGQVSSAAATGCNQ